MTVVDVVYYWSRFSPKCVHITKLLNSCNVPVRHICIDSPRTRAAVRSGKFFKLDGVPTITVKHDDGNLFIYKGDDALKWARAVNESDNGISDTRTIDQRNKKVDEVEPIVGENEFQLLDDNQESTMAMTDDNGKINIQAVMKNAEIQRKRYADQFGLQQT